MELKTDQTPKVQLGCGTLILIALIVLMFSGRGGTQKLQSTIDELNAKVDRLEKKIDALAPHSSAP